MYTLLSENDRYALDELNKKVRDLYFKKEYSLCEDLIKEAMSSYPHAAHPHNLYGILLEREGNQHGAMCHYRAANALEPTYIPARYNLYRYGDFSNKEKPAFTVEECTRQ
jgi:Flp pilus assembly protein TadD